MAYLTTESPLQFVKGVGPKKADVLALFGMTMVRDLLYYLPRAYLDRTSVRDIAQVRIGEYVTIIGVVKAHGLLHGKRHRYEVILDDGTSSIQLVWFQGIQFWKRTFEKGQIYAATGIVSSFMGAQIIHPDLERLEDNSDRMIHAGRIIPVYPQTAELTKVGLNSKGIRRLTSTVFDELSDTLSDPLPGVARSSLKLPCLHDAVHDIHYPESREQIETSRRRLAFDELLELQFLVYRNKGKKHVVTKTHTYASPGQMVKGFHSSLPFPLTAGQSQAVQEIYGDLQSPHPMARLLQGDVGCGKTVVALAACAYAAENMLQSAFMVPTEILADQHYRNWKEPLESLGIRVGLITAALSTAKKKQIAAKVATGEINLVFGTHALIYDYMTFQNLGLVIIDEQHRFGVEQRGRLYRKGDNPDLLVMTATPIPRTLALTLYNDLDVSTIPDLPPGRKPARTVWRLSDARDKVYEYVREQVTSEGQAYIVFPLIEQSEQTDLQSAEQAFAELTEGPLRGIPTALVHGRMKASDRDAKLGQFRQGSIKVLVATTVIEVGLDNPNATILVIEQAERFGLAQLHQLRGRVGRGNKSSTVVALAYEPVSEIAHRRLDYFASTTDGFAISEADLELRGPGEIFGLRQSGLPELRIANLARDRDLLEHARTLLERLFRGQNHLDRVDQSFYDYLQERAGARDMSLGGG